MKRNTGVEPVIYRLIVFAVCILKLEESRGVEPHPILHENLVFKTSRRTIPTALLSICLVPHDRIELPTPDYKTGVIPFN